MDFYKLGKVIFSVADFLDKMNSIADKLALAGKPVIDDELVQIILKILASDPVFHSCTKHLDVDDHYVREKVVRGELLVNFICSQDQIADLFTKDCLMHVSSWWCPSFQSFLNLLACGDVRRSHVSSLKELDPLRGKASGSF